MCVGRGWRCECEWMRDDVWVCGERRRAVERE